MPCCCRCNRTGKCRNCQCAKLERSCTNCLPLRLGKCENSDPPDPPDPPDHENPPSQPPSPNGSRIEDSEDDSQDDSSNLPSNSLPFEPTTLPNYDPMAEPQFIWGEIDPESFTQQLNKTYSEVVHWKRNIFSVPSGKAGKSFVSELSRLFRSYAEGSALESVALKAVTTMSILLLQKPSRSSKSRDHTTCLERRLKT